MFQGFGVQTLALVGQGGLGKTPGLLLRCQKDHTVEIRNYSLAYIFHIWYL